MPPKGGDGHRAPPDAPPDGRPGLRGVAPGPPGLLRVRAGRLGQRARHPGRHAPARDGGPRLLGPPGQHRGGGQVGGPEGREVLRRAGARPGGPGRHAERVLGGPSQADADEAGAAGLVAKGTRDAGGWDEAIRVALARPPRPVAAGQPAAVSAERGLPDAAETPGLAPLLAGRKLRRLGLDATGPGLALPAAQPELRRGRRSLGSGRSESYR